MSVYRELLQIPNNFVNNINEGLKKTLNTLHKFEDEVLNDRNNTREKTKKVSNAVTTLQSINEDEVQPSQQSNPETNHHSGNEFIAASQSSSNKTGRASKKRSKNEVDGMSSPEQDKRQKRNASVKAQSIISKQVNTNLTQKLRRENSADQLGQTRHSTRGRQRKLDEKENFEPVNLPDLQIKLEKISIPAEPEEMESLPINVDLKQEVVSDQIAMPPPQAPKPKPRKGAAKEIPQIEELSDEEPSSRKRTTRTKKQADPAAPPVAATRSTRSSSRLKADTEDPAPPEVRPKRTRAKKQAPEAHTEPELVSCSSQENLPDSPTEKPRPKRTRRAQKAAEKELAKAIEPEPTAIFPKEERVSLPAPMSPILNKAAISKSQKEKTNPITEQNMIKEMTEKDLAKSKVTEKELTKSKSTEKDLTKSKSTEKELTKSKSTEKELTKSKSTEKELTKSKATEKELIKSKASEKELTKSNATEKELTKSKVTDKAMTKTLSSEDEVDHISLNETKIITKVGQMDQTVVLPNGMYNHASVIPNNICNVNETVDLEACSRETFVINKPPVIMDTTVVIDKGPKVTNMTEDNSLLTDDSEGQDESYTPPKKGIPEVQPSSAVKAKVQQFEELASRVTRTKTRAMAKKGEETNEDVHTPPDKISKPVLSSDTLTKMNNLIFHNKAQLVSSSATKPRACVPAAKPLPSSTSKLSAINKAKEAAENMKREDAKKKKESLLEAKRDLQKRKREEKMAAAAAARNAAEKERQAAMEAAAKERLEKQAHADLGKVERMKEAERKKQELARKVAETEERRKAEELARQQRLEEEQRKAMLQRQKQIEEQEAMKREAAKMAKEIEKKHREYIEKQKKQRLEDKSNTPFKTPGVRLPPTCMEDGFQYLVSDEEDESGPPAPDWWRNYSKRQHRFIVQSQVPAALINQLFRLRKLTPDLCEIFPNIERSRLKRTSSAIWRTPERLPTVNEQAD